MEREAADAEARAALGGLRSPCAEFWAVVRRCHVAFLFLRVLGFWAGGWMGGCVCGEEKQQTMEMERLACHQAYPKNLIFLEGWLVGPFKNQEVSEETNKPPNQPAGWQTCPDRTPFRTPFRGVQRLAQGHYHQGEEPLQAPSRAVGQSTNLLTFLIVFFFFWGGCVCPLL